MKNIDMENKQSTKSESRKKDKKPNQQDNISPHDSSESLKPASVNRRLNIRRSDDYSILASVPLVI